jgi:hypothetical protein
MKFGYTIVYVSSVVDALTFYKEALSTWLSVSQLILDK